MRNIRDSINVVDEHQSTFRELGINLDSIFTHQLIQPWRVLPGDRDNSVLQATLPDGRRIRWHVKRYAAVPPEALAPAEAEAAGQHHLVFHKIPTASIIGWGVHRDWRSFVISEDLAEHDAADNLISSGMPFGAILESTADLAAKLHNAQLHHRDLYLCHFFVNKNDSRDVKLIDVARVQSFDRAILKRRWIVKDLAQFWYSTLALPITDDQRLAWLDRYALRRRIASKSLLSSIKRKSGWIARHDRKLKLAQPSRNVSIPH